MRKTLTFLVAMLVFAPLWAQSSRLVPAGQNQQHSQIQRNWNEPMVELPAGTTTGVPMGTVTTDAVTAIKIGESSNAFTFLVPETNQITAVNTANGGAVGFIYRQNIGQCGGATTENGLYRASVSVDGGLNFNNGSAGISNAAATPAGCYGIGPLNPTYTQASRYPNFLLSNPTGGTTAADLIGVYTGPVLAPSGTGWDGVVTGVVQNPTGTATVSQEAYLYQNFDQYFSYSLTERVPGEYWYAAWSFEPGGTDGIVGTEIFLNKGVYDPATGDVNWTVAKNYNMPFVRYLPAGGTDSATARTTPNIAFSPDGTVGYLSLLGDINDRDSVFLPILAKSSDGGQTWGDPFEIKMRQFRELVDTLQTFWIVVDTANNDTIPAGTGVPTCGFDHDVTVDKNGNFHFLAIVGNASSNNAAGVRGRPNYSISSGLRMFACDFTLDSFGDPNMLVLYPQTTFRGNFGLLGAGGSDETTADPYTQMSRSQDGSKVFFVWTESDTTGNFGDNDNSNPNLFTRSLDVDNLKLTQVTNWTGDDATWVSRAVMPHAAPVSLNVGANAYRIPVVIIDVGTNVSLINPVSFWYFGNVGYTNADYTIDAEFFYNCKENPFTNTVTPTLPGCGASNGGIMVNAAGGLGTYSYEWSANAGGVTTPMVSGLAAGVYTVTVTDEAGCTDDITVVLNNADAPVLTVDSTSNISCFGDGNGYAAVTAVPVGAATVASYLWSNGETTAIATGLPAGTSTLTVTDNLGCQAVTSVTISEPSAISVNATSTNARCFGDATGTSSASAFGGTGTLSYTWNNGATTPSLSGLAAGTYTVTVTDANGCATNASVDVTEPAELLLTLSSNGNTATQAPFNGFATVNYAGGTDPVEFVWTGPDNFTGSSNIIFGLNGGTYLVTATDANGCVTVDSVVVSGRVETGINIDDELAAGITTMRMFPNPNGGLFTLSLELDRVEDVQIAIVNLNGQVVEAVEVRNALVVDQEINLRNHAAGIYFVQVTTSRGTAGRRVVVR